MLKKLNFIIFIIIFSLTYSPAFSGWDKETKPSGADQVSYYSPDWMPDGKRIAYVKRIIHLKYHYDFLHLLAKGNVTTESTDYQICIYDLDKNEEKIIQTITVREGYDGNTKRIYYIWNDTKYEEIKEIWGLDVNPNTEDILIATQSSYMPSDAERRARLRYEYDGGPVYIISSDGKQFEKIIDKNVVNPRWTYRENKIIYGVKETKITRRGEGQNSVWDYEDNNSFWVVDLTTKATNKLSDKISKALLDLNNKKVINGYDDLSLDGKYLLFSNTLFDARSNRKIQVYPNIGRDSRFSSDIQRIVSSILFGSNGGICIINIDGSGFKILLKNYEEEFN